MTALQDSPVGILRVLADETRLAFRLQTGARVAGRVADENSQPLAGVRERIEAIRLATQAREAGFQPAVGYLEIEPMMESVRDDPRIVAMFEDSRREIEEQRLRIEAEEIAAGER